MRGRIRTVKPELFLDERLWDLAQETGLPVLQAFIGLWCHADREGRCFVEDHVRGFYPNIWANTYYPCVDQALVCLVAG